MQLPADMPQRQRAPDDASEAGMDAVRKADAKGKGRHARRSCVAKAISHLPQSRPGSAEEEEVQKLLFRKSLLQFSTVERCEAMFPPVRPSYPPCHAPWSACKRCRLIASAVRCMRGSLKCCGACLCVAAGGAHLCVQKPAREAAKRVMAAKANMPWVNEAAADAERHDPSAYGAAPQVASSGQALAATVTAAVAARLERATGTLHRRTMQTVEQLAGKRATREGQVPPAATGLLAKLAKSDGPCIRFAAGADDGQAEPAHARSRGVTLVDLCEIDSVRFSCQPCLG